MKNKLKFSFIIPVYNCEAYIERCIQGILNQNYENIEVLIVNDGSTDNTKKICDELVGKDSRLVLINKKNAGVSAARNDALKKVTGDYICFLDADDYLDDNYLKKVCEIINKHKDLELINFGFYSETINKKNEVSSCDEIKYKYTVYTNHEEIKKDFVNLWDNTMLYNIWNKVYSARIIKNNKIIFPKYNWGEDMQFNKDYLDKINFMINVDECYYHYVREREGAATKIYKSNIFDIRVKEFYDFNDYFEKWHIDKKEYYEFSCRRYIERVLGCIENIYNSKMNFKERYEEIKKIITHKATSETIKYAKPKSIKIKTMLIPIRIKWTLMVMITGKTIHIIKEKFPSFFNKLKNRR